MVPVMSQHAEMLTLEVKGSGRRVQRNPMHERLQERRRITPAEYDAVEDFVSAFELLHRAGSSTTLGRLGGHGSFGPSEAVLNASVRVRLGVERMGAWRTPILIDACIEALTVAAMAQKYRHSDGGAARLWMEGMVLEAIRMLAGTWNGEKQ